MSEKFEVVKVPIESIMVDPEMQRPIKEAQVRYLLENWDPRACGLIMVNKRADGKLYCMCGQHRLETMKRLRHDYVLVMVFEGLTREQEAEVYVTEAKRYEQHPLVKHKMRLIARDGQALRVQRICEDAGFVIPSHSGEAPAGSLMCIKTLYDAEEDGTLPATLKFIDDAYGKRADACRVWVVGGVSMMFKYRAGELDYGRLVERCRAAGMLKLEEQFFLRKRIAPGATGGLSCANALLDIYRGPRPGLRFNVEDLTVSNTRRGAGSRAA